MADTKTTTYNIDLIVEDGTGNVSANSYVSLNYADNYCKNRGYSTWMSQSTYVKSAAIIKAMDYVDNIFNWRGKRMNQDQTCAFPRKSIVDDEGFDWTGKIPTKLKNAICEAAFYVYNQYSLYVKKDTNGALKVDRKKADVAEIEKQYFSSDEVTIDYTSAYESLDKMLRGLFNQKGQAGSVNCHAIWSN